MNRKTIAIGIAMAMLAVLCFGAFAASRGERHIVAILDFETRPGETSDYGQAIPDMLSTFLAGNSTLQVVERSQVRRLIGELSIVPSAPISDAARKAFNQKTGARFLVTGSAFVVGKELFITVKIVSTETGKVAPLLAKGPAKAEIDKTAKELSSKIGNYIAEHGEELLPDAGNTRDVAGQLRKAFQGKELPSFIVAISERTSDRPVTESAAGNEIAFLLNSVGAKVLATGPNGAGEWAREYVSATGREIPADLREADVIIVGEGVSENLGTVNQLVSVKARLELKAVDTKTGRILAVGRATVTAVDLAESTASKSALQKAASMVCLTFLPEAVAAYEKEHAK